jgi:hypothetical protein
MSYDGLATDRKMLNVTQTQLLTKYLRWSTRLDQWHENLINAGRAVPMELSTRIPMLGHASVRQVAEQMDVDCDGRRDIGVYDPPADGNATGTFRILLSTKNFSQSPGQFLSVQLGKLGDIPMVADMNGDCAADVIVYQPGGGINRDDPADPQGVWRWCTTNPTNPTTATCSPSNMFAFGTREDIPLPGLIYSTTNFPHITTFRPRTGVWTYCPVAQGNVLCVSRTLGLPGSIPMPGLYDNDKLTDFAVYEPGTGNFKLLRSELNWMSPITRSFGSKYVASVSGTATQRSGAIPLSGMTRSQRICQGTGPIQFCWDYPRRVFSLFFPQEGSWNTMWDPINSSTIDSCVFGTDPASIPVPGVRYDADLFSDMFYYHGAGYSGSGCFNIKTATPSVPGSCSGAISGITSSHVYDPRAQVFAVYDITGDGKPDLMKINPNDTRILWFTSESNFLIGRSVDFGNPMAIVL